MAAIMVLAYLVISYFRLVTSYQESNQELELSREAYLDAASELITKLQVQNRKLIQKMKELKHKNLHKKIFARVGRGAPGFNGFARPVCQNEWCVLGH